MSSVLDSIGGLAKSAAIIFIGTVLARGLGLLGEIFIIRSLTPETFGVVALAYTTVLTLSRIGLLGIPSGVARNISAEDSLSEKESILQGGYIIALGGAIVLASVVFLLRGNIADLMGTTQISNVLILFLPFILLYPLSRVSISALRAQKRSVAAVLVKDLGPRTMAIFVFLVLAAVSRPFLGAVVYWITIPLSSVVLAIGFLFYKGPLRPSLEYPEISTLRNLWSFSWPLAIGSSLILLMSNLDVLMIGFFLNSTEVGFYRSIQPLRQITGFILSSFVFLFLPLATEYYSEEKLDELRELYTISSKWIALGTLPFVLVFSLFASDVTQVFFGEQYQPAAPALSVLTAGLFFNALVGPNGAMIKAINRPRMEMYAASVGLVTNVLLNVTLIPAFGIVGAAVATVFGYIVFNTIEVAVIYSATGSNPFSLNTIKPLVATTTIGIGIMHLSTDITFNFAGLVIVGIILSFVQLLSIFLTRSYEKADSFLLRKIKDQMGI